MTIDEAIKNLEYGIEQMTMELKSGLWETGSDTEAQVKQGIELNQQLIAWLTELKESRRLLKLAVEDFDSVVRRLEGNDILCMKYIACKGCPFDSENCNKWRGTDEALKLLNDEK